MRRRFQWLPFHPFDSARGKSAAIFVAKHKAREVNLTRLMRKTLFPGNYLLCAACQLRLRILRIVRRG